MSKEIEDAIDALATVADAAIAKQSENDKKVLQAVLPSLFVLLEGLFVDLNRIADALESLAKEHGS